MNYIYIHVCCLGNWIEVLNYFIFCIRTSGLYDKVEEIRCCVLGDADKIIFVDPKIKLRKNSKDTTLYETFTINTLHEDCHIDPSLQDANVLYMHTKGITKTGIIAVNHWVEYMCHFNILEHESCLKMLEHCDTIGVDLKQLPVLHYSGNFWWAKTGYIKTLEPCVHTTYNSPEFWIVEKMTGIHGSLWESGISNHYTCYYPAKLYANIEIQPIIIKG